jgi:hypothetical protein
MIQKNIKKIYKFEIAKKLNINAFTINALLIKDYQKKKLEDASWTKAQRYHIQSRIAFNFLSTLCQRAASKV